MKTANEIGNELLKAPKRPMEKDESLGFVSVVMSRQLPPEEKLPLAGKIAKARWEDAGVKATIQMAWVVAIFSDRPGTAVLYSAAVKALYDRLGREVTLDDFSAPEAFGFGPVTDDALEAIWDGQKIYDGNGPDNVLDRKEAWTTNA